MDLYQSSIVPTRVSSLRVFSRTCSNNTRAFAQDGRQIEPQWQAARPSPDQQRQIAQSIASWDGTSVFQLEGCQPFFQDADIAGLGGINNRVATTYPLYDPDGSGWTVYSTDPTNQLASFNLLRNNCNITTAFRFPGFFGNVSLGFVLRLVDANNFLRLRINFNFSPLVISLEGVVSGVATTLSSTPLIASGFDNSYTATITCNNAAISAQVNSVDQFGTPRTANVTTTTTSFQTATRFGLWLSQTMTTGAPTLTPATIDTYLCQSANPAKDFVGCYSAGGTPTHNGSVNEANPSGYGSFLVVGNAIAYQEADVPFYTGPGPGILFSPPSDAGYGNAQLLNSEGIGFGARSGYIPMISDNPKIAGPIGGYFWGGREIDTSGRTTPKSILTGKSETWQPAGGRTVGQSSGGDLFLIDQPPRTNTLSQLGKEVIGTKSRYGYPNCCGFKLDNVELVQGVNRIRIVARSDGSSVTLPGDYWIVRGTFKAIAGPLVDGGSTGFGFGKINYAPHIGESLVIATWTIETIMQTSPDPIISGPAGQPPNPPIPPTENDMRMSVMGFVQELALPNAPWVFDCNPGMSVWVCGLGMSSYAIKSDALDTLTYFIPDPNGFNPGPGFDGYGPRFLVQDGFPPYTAYETTNVVPSMTLNGPLPTGYGFPATNPCVIGPDTPYILVWDPTGRTVMSQIQGGFDFLNYGHGLLSGGASCASDRFWYCGCAFDSEDSAYAFSTADLSRVKNQKTPQGFPNAPSLKNSYWAINKSGSIRYPLLAVNELGQYVARADIDNTSGIQGWPNGDCVKASDKLAPPLSNPTF